MYTLAEGSSIGLAAGFLGASRGLFATFMKVSAAHTAGDFEIGLAGGIANFSLCFKEKIAGITQRAIRNKQPTLA